MNDTTVTASSNGDGEVGVDVDVDCQQRLPTPALVGMISGSVVVAVALITLICSIFWYIPSRKIQRAAIHSEPYYDTNDDRIDGGGGVYDYDKKGHERHRAVQR